MSNRSGPHSGLTLLELMLAMALTAVIMAAIGMAIDLHLRMVDSRRTSVETSQIAQAILRRIADDLRGTIQQNSVDVSGAEQLAGDTLSQDTELGAAAEEMGLGESSLSSASEDIAAATTVPVMPGLYGNQYELQLDVSRLPRVDEFQRMISPDALYTIEDIPSDVKTIAYYLQDGYRSADTFSAPASMGAQQQAGLVRRVLDRAVTLYATENANLDGLQQVGEVIAPEVSALEFEYFDGLEWVLEWDMEIQGGLPVAVRITLVIGGLDLETTASSSGTSSIESLPAASGEVYSLVVRLPTAEPVEVDGTTDLDGLGSVGL